MAYYVGLTGNIASGKTTVSKIFKTLGIDVINADVIARTLTTHNPEVLKQIAAHFGADILCEKGMLDRARLRDIIFSDAHARQWLEALLHPLIRAQLEREIRQSTSPYTVVEIPLHIDKKHYPYIDRVVLVRASEPIQIKRVMERDQCTKEQALAILSAQPSMEERLKTADDIIDNDADEQQLTAAIHKLHADYLAASKQQAHTI